MENRKLLLKHMQQGPNQCGPTALAIVLDYWGLNVPLPEVVQAVKPLDFMFAACLDLVQYAQERGLTAQPYNASDWEELKRLIRLRIPPIALIDPGTEPDWNLHYVVVNGFLEEGVDRRVFYVDPGRAVGGGQCEVSWDEFSRRWGHLKLRQWPTGHHRYLLLIAPPELARFFPPFSPERCRLRTDRAARLLTRVINGGARAAARVWQGVRWWSWFLRPRRFDKPG